MKPVRAALLGLATLTGAGCFTARPSGPDWFLHHAARNMTEQPIAHHDERKFTRYVQRRADEAWELVCRSSGRKHGDPYGEGFREGFVDYVEAGGTGEPPYLPPFRYRLTKYRNTDGIQTVESWYAGFRHGAAVARESGLRELNYVPLPGPVILNDSPAPALAGTASGAPAPVPSSPPGPANGVPEPLPAPRPVAPGAPPQMPEPEPPAEEQAAEVPMVSPAPLPLLVPAPPPPPIARATAVPSEPPGAIVPAEAAAPHRPVPNNPPAFTSDRGAAVAPVIPGAWAAVARPKEGFGPWLPARPLRVPPSTREP